MKKLTMFLMAMAIGFAASAQSLVYDFKASYQAIAPFYQKVTYTLEDYDGSGSNYTKYTAYFDTFDVVKDSLKGYLALESCDDCGEGSDYFPKYGILWVQRKGDKLYQDIYAMEVDTEAAMFNKGVGSRLGNQPLAGTPTSLKKLKKAWFCMELPTIGVTEESVNVEVKNLASEQTTVYGFLGYQNTETMLGGCGFGKVSVIVNKGSQSIGFCGTEITPGSTCTALSSAKGCFGGGAYYIGLCSQVPMWDICDITASVDWAPVCGDFSIKLNKKLSAQFVDDDEDAILAKFKSYGDVIYVNDNEE
jgi:hypothetical protein